MCLCLLLCACGEEKALSDHTTPTQAQSVPRDSLDILRYDMKPPVIAVANFGFPDVTDGDEIMNYLWAEYPQWMTEHDFIGKIPDKRIILASAEEGWGNLVCVVPRDPEADIAVTASYYADPVPEELYRSKTGEPILILADISEDVTVTVTVTDSEGRGVSWQPYWDNPTPIPEDGYLGALVMDFTPLSEKTGYDFHVEQGWYTPDPMALDGGCWQSDYGYVLELSYEPGQFYDGTAMIYDIEYDGTYLPGYSGNWVINRGNLELTLVHVDDDSITVSCALPVLADPYGGFWLGLGAPVEGAFPYFTQYADFDELVPTQDDSQSPYDHYRTQGWRPPELEELTDTFWLSYENYALKLADDSVPGNSGGWATLYDVGAVGEYTESHTGAWDYEDSMLHLSLVPLDNGVMVDETFPVLTLDGELWIFRSESGLGLPHFSEETMLDVLLQPRG